MDNYSSPFGTNKTPEDAAIDELLNSIRTQQQKANSEKAAVDEGLSTLASAFFEDEADRRTPDKVAPNFDALPPLPDNSDAVQTYSGINPIWDELDLTTSTEVARQEELNNFVNENPFSDVASDQETIENDFGFTPQSTTSAAEQLESGFPPLENEAGETTPSVSQDTVQLVYPRAAEPVPEEEPYMDSSYFAGAFSAIKGVPVQPQEAEDEPLPEQPAEAEEEHIDFDAGISLENAVAVEPEPVSYNIEPIDTELPSDDEANGESLEFEQTDAPLNPQAELEKVFTVDPAKEYDEFSDETPSFSTIGTAQPPVHEATETPAPQINDITASIPPTIEDNIAQAPSASPMVPDEDNEFFAALNAAPDEADSFNEDDELEPPPYIAPRAVKRGGKKKKGAKKGSAKSSSKKRANVSSGKKKGRGGLIALAAVLVVIIAAAAVFFPTLSFSYSLFTDDYSAAATKYENGIATSELQTKVSNKVANYFANRILNSYLGGELSYDQAAEALLSLSSVSGLGDAVAQATDSLSKLHTSDEAFALGVAALDEGDLITAVEQLSLVDAVSPNCDTALVKLTTAKDSLKSSILDSTKNNFANGYFTACFKAYDTAERLLPDDSDIAAQYATHEGEFEAYITSVINAYILEGKYNDAYANIVYAVNLAHNSADLKALYDSYTPWIAPINVFTLSSENTNSADSGYSDADWNESTDTDSVGNSYTSGKIFTVTVSNAFEREYNIDGAYEQLTGTVTAHANSAGIGSSSISGTLYIYGDGSLLYSSGAVNGTTQPEAFTVDVSDVDDLTIIFDIDTADSTSLSLAVTNFNLFKTMDELKATIQQ